PRGGPFRERTVVIRRAQRAHHALRGAPCHGGDRSATASPRSWISVATSYVPRKDRACPGISDHGHRSTRGRIRGRRSLGRGAAGDERRARPATDWDFTACYRPSPAWTCPDAQPDDGSARIG